MLPYILAPQEDVIESDEMVKWCKLYSENKSVPSFLNAWNADMKERDAEAANLAHNSVATTGWGIWNKHRRHLGPWHQGAALSILTV